jgi:hypothetical protein
MHDCQNTRTWHTTGIAAQSFMLETVRNGDEWTGEVHRLSAAGQPVSEIAEELRRSVRGVVCVRPNLGAAKRF